MTARIARLLLAAGAIAALTPWTASAGQAHVPVCLRAAPLHPPAAATREPEGAEWSAVLADVPVPTGAGLAFLEVRPGEVPVAVADYAVDSMDSAALGRWYRDSLAGLGWQLAEVSAAGQTWHKGTRSLKVDLPGGADSRWLRLTRDAAGVRAAAGRSLVGGLPLPASARRWRYDRADLLVEEVRLSASRQEAERAVTQTLTDAGWRQQGDGRLAGAPVLRFSGAAGAVVVAVRQATATESEIGIGTVDCLASTTPGDLAESVYLDQVPAPADSALAAFERGAEGQGLERWRAACQDLDLLAARTRADWSARDRTWTQAATQRGPSAVTVVAQPAAGSAVTSSAHAMPAGGVETVLSRAADGLRRPAGRSLLFPDLPLPIGAEAERLVHDPEGDWPWLETYGLPGAPDAVLEWYRLAMPPLGWRLLREGVGGEPESAAYYSGGEETAVSVSRAAGTLLGLRRRRVCASDEPAAAPSEGGHARYLSEMPVFPGAVYEGYEAPSETYSAICTSLDQLEAWYRMAVEQGNWSLAMVVGPEDPYVRTLTFVRPEERALPPELRTAWAEVTLERLWSYSYRLTHRRDSGGVLPRLVAP